nr:ORF45 [Human gammaherpesvirus 8]
MAMFVRTSSSTHDEERMLPIEGAPRRRPPVKFIFPPPPLSSLPGFGRPRGYAGPTVIDMSAPDDVFAEDTPSPPATPLDLQISPDQSSGESEYDEDEEDEDEEENDDVQEEDEPEGYPADFFQPLSHLRPRPLARRAHTPKPVAVVAGRVRSSTDTAESEASMGWVSQDDGFSPAGLSPSDDEGVAILEPMAAYTGTGAYGLSPASRNSVPGTQSSPYSDPDEGPSWRPLRAAPTAIVDLTSDSDSDDSPNSPDVNNEAAFTDARHFSHQPPSSEEDGEDQGEVLSQRIGLMDVGQKRKRQSTASSGSEDVVRCQRQPNLSRKAVASVIIISSGSDTDEEPSSAVSVIVSPSSTKGHLPTQSPSTSAHSISSGSTTTAGSRCGDPTRILASTPPLCGNGAYNWPWLD